MSVTGFSWIWSWTLVIELLIAGHEHRSPEAMMWIGAGRVFEDSSWSGLL